MFKSKRVAAAVAAVSFVVASVSEGALLSPGARSGSVSVTAYGRSSGPDGPFTNIATGSLPGSGAGNVSVTTSAGSFGINPLQGDTATGVAGVQLGTVSGDSYDLAASASSSWTYTGNSGQCAVVLGFSYSQEIVISEPVNFTLTLTEYLPAKQRYDTIWNADNGMQLYAPISHFTGPGVNHFGFVNSTGTGPVTQTDVFSGVLQPGTYTFSSTWSSGGLAFSAGEASVGTQTVGLSAHLAVSAVPEPGMVAVVGVPALVLGRRRRAR